MGLALKRLTKEVTAALRRRPPGEERLAGALRALAPKSEEGLALLVDTATTLARRGAFERPLLQGSLRALVEVGDERVAHVLSAALSTDDVPLGVLGAICFCKEKSLEGALVRGAIGRPPPVLFVVEMARVLRGESRGDSLEALALRLKEASRIDLCSEVFWPMLRAEQPCEEATAALAVFRDAERHLGRWRLLAELAVRSGDERPRQRAQTLASEGPVSARGAWALIDWALSRSTEPPPHRSSLDVLVRLSDRPTNEKNLSFLFRLASLGALQLRAHLEGLAEHLATGDENAIRAAFFLIRDHGREDLRERVRGVARLRKEGSWGLAAAVLHDLGDSAAEEIAKNCLEARSLTAVAWGGLVLSSMTEPARVPLLVEPRVRQLHLGLLA